MGEIINFTCKDKNSEEIDEILLDPKYNKHNLRELVRYLINLTK